MLRFDRNKAEMLHHISSVQLQVEEVRFLTVEITEGIRALCRKSELLWGPTIKGQFDYPVDKRRNKVPPTECSNAQCFC